MASPSVYLDLLLHNHESQLEHPREKLILLVHWKLLFRDFRVEKDHGFNEILKWKKDEYNTINLDYFREELVMHVELKFTNEHFFIQLKMDEDIQSNLKMEINNYVNAVDGSLKNVDEFIFNVSAEYFECITKKKQMDLRNGTYSEKNYRNPFAHIDPREIVSSVRHISKWFGHA